MATGIQLESHVQEALTCKMSCSRSRCFCCWYSLYSSLLESRTLPPDTWPWPLGVELRSVKVCEGDDVLGGVGLPPIPEEDTWSEKCLASTGRDTWGGPCCCCCGCCCSTRDERGEATIRGSSVMEVRVSTTSPWAKSLSMDMSMGLRGWGVGGGGREDKVGAGAIERERAARSPDVTWTTTNMLSLWLPRRPSRPDKKWLLGTTTLCKSMITFLSAIAVLRYCSIQWQWFSFRQQNDLLDCIIGWLR